MRILSALITTTWSPETRYGVKLGLSLPISMRATFVASRPRTTFVASTTNQFAPTFSACASSPLATYVLIATVTPFPVETNVNLNGRTHSCQRGSQPAFEEKIYFGLIVAMGVGVVFHAVARGRRKDTGGAGDGATILPAAAKCVVILRTGLSIVPG